MILSLQPGEARSFPTPGKYLNVISASDVFTIANPERGLAATTAKSGWIITLENFASVELTNPNASAMQLELESSQLQISAAGGESVAISNKPVIQRIEESIRVDAQATVNNGTVHVISGSQLPAADKSVPANTKVKLLDANPDRKSVLVQVISDSRTELRVGDINVTTSAGVYLAGDKSAPSVLPMDYSGAVYAHNDSGTTAKLSVVEVLK